MYTSMDSEIPHEAFITRIRAVVNKVAITKSTPMDIRLASRHRCAQGFVFVCGEMGTLKKRKHRARQSTPVEDVSDDDVLAEAKSGAMKVSQRWASERVVT